MKIKVNEQSPLNMEFMVWQWAWELDPPEIMEHIEEEVKDVLRHEWQAPGSRARITALKMAMRLHEQGPQWGSA